MVAPAERLDEETFTPSTFRVIGVQPQLGHVFTDAENQVDIDSPVMLISDRFLAAPHHGLVRVSEADFTE